MYMYRTYDMIHMLIGAEAPLDAIKRPEDGS